MPHSINDPEFAQVPTPLRVVRSEASPPYDGAPKQAPFVKLPDAVLFDSRLSPWARLTYAALVHHRGVRGCFPQRGTLATELGTSLRVLDRALAELAATGLVVKKRRGQGRANEYDLPHTATEHNDSPSMAGLESPPVASLESPNTATRTRTRELEKKNHPPPPFIPPETGGMGVYESLLGGSFSKASALFTEAHNDLHAGWLRLVLRDAEGVCGSLSFEMLTDGLWAAERAIRAKVRSERPPDDVAAWSRAVLTNKLREVAAR